MLRQFRAEAETGSADTARGEGAEAATAADHHHVDRGWRRASREPSLADVFGTIKTRPTGPLWKKLIAFLGPGYLVAVGYMDPGNWATSLAGGSKFGYALLVDRAPLQHHGDHPPGAVRPARRRVWPRPGAGLPRRLPAGWWPGRSGLSPSSPSAPPISPR